MNIIKVRRENSPVPNGLSKCLSTTRTPFDELDQWLLKEKPEGGKILTKTFSIGAFKKNHYTLRYNRVMLSFILPKTIRRIFDTRFYFVVNTNKL